MKTKWIVLLTLIFFLNACSGNSSTSNAVVHSTEDTTDLKKLLDNQTSINGYQSVMDKENILVAIEVPKMQRFKKVKVEGKIKKEIEKKFPDKEVVVKDDLKIKWELEKVIKKDGSSKDLKKSIKKIIALSKEET